MEDWPENASRPGPWPENPVQTRFATRFISVLLVCTTARPTFLRLICRTRGPFCFALARARLVWRPVRPAWRLACLMAWGFGLGRFNFYWASTRCFPLVQWILDGFQPWGTVFLYSTKYYCNNLVVNLIYTPKSVHFKVLSIILCMWCIF